jgi:hypothetical protein
VPFLFKRKEVNIMAYKKNKSENKPLKWKSPEELQEKINNYFEECKRMKEVPTISGLAYALETNRQTLLNYENAEENGWLSRLNNSTKRAYVDTIKNAKHFVESRYEQALFQQGKTIGAIFTLKNNFGYVDKQEVEQTNKTITVELED